MLTPGIEFRGIWKKFHRTELHDSLRDLIPAMARRLAGRGPVADELSGDEFWALKDVSFDVEPGQALGIIGPNGAGKSTVLKILNRILRPNRGTCTVRGRVGALIELAAGFHPDLTGRENVYLQGSIMGMRRAEIRTRFDQIVEFSGIEEFLDMPVKRYSSGMNARLGFSIAAHMNTDVLLIDEVLSVGDLPFQQKAFGRLQELAASGMPIVVVSHQLNRIESLCSDAILLGRGEVTHQGSAEECVAAYVLGYARTESSDEDCPIQIQSLTVEGPQDVRSGEYISIVVIGTTEATEDLKNLAGVSIRVRSAHTGKIVFTTNSGVNGVSLPVPGQFTLGVDLQLNVKPGIYSIETAVWDNSVGRQRADGPSTQIVVEKGKIFDGTIQMNPRLRLLRDVSQEEQVESLSE